MKLTHFILTAAFAALPLVGIAQTTSTTPTTTPDTHHTIAQRQENQQDRIAQGVKSGELTAGETATLEKQEAGINKEESGMRAQDNGYLTAQDKKTLNTQLNVESKDIYADKHNDATQPGTPKPTKETIGERKVNQQDRIAQGVKSGSLSAGETATLEKQEAGINKEESGMRAQDNGHLTAQDKKTLTAQQNVESKDIYDDKHNDVTQSTSKGEINERKDDQQARIAQGIKSGQLTAGETAKLETQGAGINKEEAGMRAQDNGKLTSQDKKTINQQQNQESRRIYRDKHNTVVRGRRR